jgi:hypothetical protein
VLASVGIAGLTSPDNLPKLLERIVVLQVWIAGIAAYYLFQELGAGVDADGLARGLQNA